MRTWLNNPTQPQRRSRRSSRWSVWGSRGSTSRWGQGVKRTGRYQNEVWRESDGHTFVAGRDLLDGGLGHLCRTMTKNLTNVKVEHTRCGRSDLTNDQGAGLFFRFLTPFFSERSLRQLETRRGGREEGKKFRGVTLTTKLGLSDHYSTTPCSLLSVSSRP